VRRFDIDSVRSRFLEYTKAGGAVLPGLVKRRLAEVTWIGEGISQSAVPSQTHAAVASPIGTDDSSRTETIPRTVETSLAPTTSRAESAPLVDDTQSIMPITMDAAAAERASSVAWMLLALDMGTFAPGLIDDRDREASAAS
jgi:hypothetical protein